MVNISKILRLWIVDNYTIDINQCTSKNSEYLFPYGVYYKIDTVKIGRDSAFLYVRPTDNQIIEFYIRNMDIKIEVFYESVFEEESDYEQFLVNYKNCLKEMEV